MNPGLQDPDTDPNPGVLPGPTGGEGNNWEGTGPGGGSTLATGSVNTQTGNRLTAMPIVGWKTKGGLSFGLTLFHNTQENVDLGWGQNWRSEYDMRVVYTGKAGGGDKDHLTVAYPTGKRLTFTRQAGQGEVGPFWFARFMPPKGYHDIVFFTGAEFQLRSPDMMLYRFDATGFLKAKSDRFGNTITVTRAAGRLMKVADASNRSLSFTWSTISLPTPGGFTQTTTGITKVKNDQSLQTWNLQQTGPLVPSNNRTKFLTKVTLPTLGSNTYTHLFNYTNSGTIMTEVDTLGKAYKFTYDGYSRLTTFKDPLLNTHAYTYNASNTVLTKPDGYMVTDYYDGGVLRSVKDEAGYSQSYGYDSDGNLVTLVDERGNESRYSYDAFGNCISSQDPRQYVVGKKILTSYNSYNDPLTMTDTRNAITVLTLDGRREDGDRPAWAWARGLHLRLDRASAQRNVHRRRHEDRYL